MIEAPRRRRAPPVKTSPKAARRPCAAKTGGARTGRRRPPSAHTGDGGAEAPDARELAYEGIRRDMMRLFEDPRAGAQALVARLRAMDRDTVRALATSIPGLTPERVDHFVATVLKARDEVVATAERARDEVERRLASAREEAVRDAEEARQTAATAAWWGFGTAVISGGAAAAGGLVAVLT